MLDRWLYTVPHLPDYEVDANTMERTNDEDEAVLRSSIVKDISVKTGIVWMDQDMHAPALDIDLPCTLIESSTKGHYHLYIDKVMPWADYEKLLTVMTEVGIIEEGFLNMSVKRKCSLLRVRDKKHDPKEAF